MCVYLEEGEHSPDSPHSLTLTEALTGQYKDPQHHAGAYWQISYTRRMKSRTDYVRREWVTELRRQVVTHKRFTRLVDEWIDLSIEHSRLTMRIAEPKAT